MTSMSLKDKLSRREAKVAIIGLGYVGLPLAMEFAKLGFKTVGIDLNRERIKKAGVKRAIFSFSDLYGKVKARNKKFALNIIDPPMSHKIDYASHLAGAAKNLGLSLESCSENLGIIEGITPSSCIDGRLLSGLSGEPAKLTKDHSQRSACNCTVSRDIGSYQDMPCYNGCLYCYANHNRSTVEKNAALHNPESPVLIGDLDKTVQIVERKFARK